MTIKLQDMLKKVQQKGYSTSSNISPWQENSIIKNAPISTLPAEKPIPKTQKPKVTGELNNKSANKPSQNWVQTGNKVGTNRVQTGYKPGTNRVQTGYKSGTQLGTSFSFSKISGVQKNILLFIFQECQLSRSKNTKPLNLEYIANHVQSNKNTVKITIKRLETKKLLKRIEFKMGRNGWTIYELPDFIYGEIVKRGAFLEKSSSLKSIDKPGTQPGTTFLSSSNIITTTVLDNIDLKNIQNVLNNPKSPQGQFFNNGSLKSIWKHSEGKLTPEQIQNSIDRFAYGLEYFSDKEPYASMENPGAILFKTLKNGDCWLEERYLSPDEVVIKNYYENICKPISEDEKKYFDEWMNTERDQKHAEYKQKLPSNHFFDDKTFMEMATKDFKENIFPDICVKKALEILGDDKKELLQKIVKLNRK